MEKVINYLKTKNIDYESRKDELDGYFNYLETIKKSRKPVMF